MLKLPIEWQDPANMNKLKRTAISVAMLLLAQGALACDYPERVTAMPDGMTATRDEMIAGKDAVQSYIANMESYLSCIEAAQTILDKVDEHRGNSPQADDITIVLLRRQD